MKSTTCISCQAGKQMRREEEEEEEEEKEEEEEAAEAALVFSAKIKIKNK